MFIETFKHIRIFKLNHIRIYEYRGEKNASNLELLAMSRRVEELENLSYEDFIPR